MLSSTVKSFGNVSDTFARSVREQAGKLDFEISGAEVAFKLHRAGELQEDVVELRHLPKEAEVIATEVTIPGYKVVGKAFSSDMRNLGNQVLDAYNSFLHNKNLTKPEGWFGK